MRMIVNVGEYGQLGNRLIVHANLLAAAREHGLSGLNLALRPHLHSLQRGAAEPLFPFPDASPARSMLAAAVRLARGSGTKLTQLLKRLQRRLRLPGIEVLDIGWIQRCDLDSPEFLDRARNRAVMILKGWQFRASESFERHTAEIRAALALRADLAAPGRALVHSLRREAEVVIGVHLRQGDYRHFEDGRFFFEAAQYNRWMHELREQFVGRLIAFVLSSNEPQSLDEFEHPRVALAPGGAVEDLAALADCDFLLAPPSTFSSWASFSGNRPLCAMRSPHAAAEITAARVVTHFDEARRPAWMAVWSDECTAPADEPEVVPA